VTASEASRVQVAVVAREVVRDLQWQVLRGGPRPADDSELGPGALTSFSIAARAGDGDVVGAATFFLEPSACAGLPDIDPSAHWRLRGMATDPALQGLGVGARVLEAGLAEVAARGGRVVWCNARVAALSFYVRQGFVVTGDVFATAETGIPHRRAWRLVGPPGHRPLDA
jgi:GNAT superfamily N-acetyltransferase